MLTLAGTLERDHLDDLLEWFHLTRATGRLMLTTATATRAFARRRAPGVVAAEARRRRS
jgi:hypothetical protein